jgi:nucleoside-diphosphate-sugar epimerase
VFRRVIGFPVSIMPGSLRLALVYAGDVADAIARALERPASVGRAYNVTGDDLPLREFVHAWREAGGPTGSVLLPIPVWMSRMFDNRRAERELGWRNRTFVEALRETFALERGGTPQAASRSR